MQTNAPAINDISFLIRHIIGYENLNALEGYTDVTSDMVDVMLTESGKISSEVLAPLNKIGDNHGCTFENGVVRTPPGFKEAYEQVNSGGWFSLNSDTDYGGQGLPLTLSTAVQEIFDSSNMAFGLIPLLSNSAVELLSAHASDSQKDIYLPNIISGKWATTMNLTEPHAGSDVGALRTKAVKAGNHYKITGEKVYITGGEHDFTENIIHLVLARTPGAPQGNKGISLFIVPKFLINEDSTIGQKNDLRCVSIEQKLGIHASPTCVMAYGDNGGAIGYLVGKENEGLACMFTMMNMARICVGVQGVGIAQGAYNQAKDYANNRVQGTRADAKGKKRPAMIIEHPDVKRMLMDMKSKTESIRALALYTSYCFDVSKRHPISEKRVKFSERVSLLTPIVKAWATDKAIKIADIGIQIHGGMGYIEESGASQYWRDARITPIYEGTNGIQAIDLVNRKIVRDDGKSLFLLIEEIEENLYNFSNLENNKFSDLGELVHESVNTLSRSTVFLLNQAGIDPDLVESAARVFLDILGNTVCAWLMLLQAGSCEKLLIAKNLDPLFLESKIKTVKHFLKWQLPEVLALEKILLEGQNDLSLVSKEDFDV